LAVRVVFLGPHHSFTHEAALFFFGDEGVEFIDVPTISSVFSSVEGYEADYGVVPVENSLEGPVGETLDNLARRMLHIYAGVELKIKLVLACSGNHRSPVYSHPHAVGEALGKVREMLGESVEVVYTTSTSHAAERAASEGGCCICSRRAAESMGLNILSSDVSEGENYTRFIVLAWRDQPEKATRTSIVTAIPDRPGALYHWLEPFAKHGVNLKMIYSRPIPSKPWHYNFYVDLEGTRMDNRVRKAIEEAARRSLFLRILGSYPVKIEA